jgi:hypothetical protein
MKGEIKTFDDVIHHVANIYKYNTIAHCDKCHHEAYTSLGSKCGWCGGAMVEEKVNE